jgi:dolichol kinase
LVKGGKEGWIEMEGYIDQIFRELPFGIAIAVVIFLGILLIIWLLLPLWVLFIQWNTAKIKDEIRSLVDQLEKRERNGKGKETVEPND